MITRIRQYDKKEPSRDAHKLYVICEGSHDEPRYFGFFEGLSSNPVRLKDAILNAGTNFRVDDRGSLAQFSTEMIYLGQEINGFVSGELAKLYNKLR